MKPWLQIIGGFKQIRPQVDLLKDLFDDVTAAHIALIHLCDENILKLAFILQQSGQRLIRCSVSTLAAGRFIAFKIR